MRKDLNFILWMGLESEASLEKWINQTDKKDRNFMIKNSNYSNQISYRRLNQHNNGMKLIPPPPSSHSHTFLMTFQICFILLYSPQQKLEAQELILRADPRKWVFNYTKKLSVYPIRKDLNFTLERINQTKVTRKIRTL